MLSHNNIVKKPHSSEALVTNFQEACSPLVTKLGASIKFVVLPTEDQQGDRRFNGVAFYSLPERHDLVVAVIGKPAKPSKTG